MKCAFPLVLLGTACLAAMQATPGSAWGSQGHQYVGNLAWKLLNPNARRHVRALLGPGVDLSEAAVWPDCVRSVKGGPVSGFAYQPDEYTPEVCSRFSGAEQNRMVDYASRNWTNCNYRDRPLECHKSYHFADVNLEAHQDYNLTYPPPETGTNDVVQAIKAATIVLKCPANQQCTVPAPFSITSKREALLLLAHFVGDAHQPLHVGAVYLDQNNAPAMSGTPTAGGNVLLIKAGDEKNNLHHEWDTVLKSLGTAPSDQGTAQACQISPLPNPTPEAPESWASDTVVAARTAYAGMTYVKDTAKPADWDIEFANRQTYLRNLRTAQARQLITAGARLAALLNSIWPSTKAARACK